MSGNAQLTTQVDVKVSGEPSGSIQSRTYGEPNSPHIKNDLEHDISRRVLSMFMKDADYDWLDSTGIDSIEISVKLSKGSDPTSE